MKLDLQENPEEVTFRCIGVTTDLVAASGHVGISVGDFNVNVPGESEFHRSTKEDIKVYLTQYSEENGSKDVDNG